MSVGDRIVQLSFYLDFPLSTVEMWVQLTNPFKPQLFHLYDRYYRSD